MSRTARLVLAFAAWLAAAAATVMVMFILLWVVAGPHSDLLPQPLQIASWIAGYAVILIVPLVVAVSVYRRLSPRADGGKRDS